MPPPVAAVRVKVLREGFWEETAIHRDETGACFVRKASKPGAEAMPWALESLRREISYLRELPADARSFFPPALRAWDDASVGYDMPYYEGWRNAAEWLFEEQPSQAQADDFQGRLSEMIFGGLHRTVPAEGSLANHVAETIRSVIQILERAPQFAPLVHSARVTVNGRPQRGLAASVERLIESPALRELNAKRVLLHGDLILENVIAAPDDRDFQRPLLLDPVSVAGVSGGHPLFDLVKYESYATGELFAFRGERLDAGPTGTGEYAWRVWRDHPRMQAFHRVDMVGAFVANYQNHHGSFSPAAKALLEGYFALVMAANTGGKQQWARVLKAVEALDLATP